VIEIKTLSSNFVEIVKKYTYHATDNKAKIVSDAVTYTGGIKDNMLDD
jgi:hypothetical protein